MVTTLRLSEELSAQLALMARVEGRSQAEIMREAIGSGSSGAGRTRRFTSARNGSSCMNGGG